jgi:ABC-type transport system substrate-binding protein
MRSGEIDLLAALPVGSEPTARSLSGVRVLDLRNYATLRLQFNLSSPIGGDLAVRRALRYATNRREIIARVYLGSGRLFEQIFVPEDPMHLDLPFQEFDPERARRILDEGGWRMSADGARRKNGLRLTIVLIAPADDIGIDKSVEIIRSDWAQVGVELSVQRVPETTLYGPKGRLVMGKYDAAIMVLGSGSIALETEWNCSAPPYFNVTRFCDSRMQTIIRRIEATDDIVLQKRLYADAQRIIEDSAVITNLIQIPVVYVLGPRVRHTHNNGWSFFERFTAVDAQ